MIRVLHVLGGLGTGGTETLIMNWYRNIDRTIIQFDFLVRSEDHNFVAEILELGGRVYYTSSFPRHLFKNYIETKNLLSKKEWDIIHVHANAAMYTLPLKLAKQYGYASRIIHSHSVEAKNKLFSVIHRLNKKKLLQYSTYCVACSEEAGRWMFGDEVFRVLKNAIDYKDFSYNKASREAIRKEYNLENKIVLGHVGRFSEPKNHVFLIDVFKEIHVNHPETVLFLVGNGALEEIIKRKVNEYDLQESVYFLGYRTDIGDVMSAMDYFVLPSLFEGLGIVLIEAQVNGLPCFVSEEAYNEEVKITNNVSKIPLSNGVNFWANCINEAINKKNYLINREKLIVANDYNINSAVEELTDFYLKSLI